MKDIGAEVVQLYLKDHYRIQFLFSGYHKSLIIVQHLFNPAYLYCPSDILHKTENFNKLTAIRRYLGGWLY